MSHLIEKETPCRSCKYPNKAELWSIINVRQDPELKDILLGGELNMIRCDSCKVIFYVEQFLIYHDPDNELLAFVYPFENRQEKEKWEKKTNDDFAASQRTAEDADEITYSPITLFGLDELVGYVEKDEESKIQSEVVEAIAKEQGFLTKTLKPYLARKQDMPRVIPHIKGNGGPSRKSVVEALSKLKSINDRLTVYNQTLNKLKDNPNLQIVFE